MWEIVPSQPVMKGRIDPANTIRVMKPSGREAASRKALEANKPVQQTPCHG
jgi:hypothetical protein